MKILQYIAAGSFTSQLPLPHSLEGSVATVENRFPYRCTGTECRFFGKICIEYANIYLINFINRNTKIAQNYR